MAEKIIQIKCRGAGTVDIDHLEHIQGNLKECKKAEMAKLIKSIVENGFCFPEFVWQQGGHNYILDGNHRVKALGILRSGGWHVPEIPYALIEADDLLDAKKKLLLINSRYAKMTDEGLFEFGHDIPDFKSVLDDMS